MINKELLDYIEDNDVKFIRLSFCDLLGKTKNISILSSELKSVFEFGRPIDSCAIPVYSDVSNSDLLLVPDASSLSLLPWRPQTNSVARFYCNVKNPDGTYFVADGRHMLRTASAELQKLGFECNMGTKCEFYLFRTDVNDNPTKTHFDNGSYLDISPLDKGENIRREVCLCFEEMGLNPESSHHEQGPGQNEIDFKFSDPLSAADNFLTLKSVVKSVATRNGLFASFMPKPLLNKSGNGMHLNISLQKDGENILSNPENENYAQAKSFIAGILEKIPEMTLFLNPINNSYERFGAFEAPKYISWSLMNRSGLIRLPLAQKGRERIELRSPDATLNPYIAFSLILYAGMYGIENKLELMDVIDCDLYNADEDITKHLRTLPTNLSEAIELARNSEFLIKHLGKDCLSAYIKYKEKEYADFTKVSDKETYYNDKDFRIL